MSSLPTILARAAAEAPTLTVASLGVTIRTLVATVESDGALAALEYTAPPRFRGPAPHWHAKVTETFIGVEGTLTLHVDSGEVALAPGAVVVVPPRVVHRFSNTTEEPARFLVLATPGAGFEGYFAELAQLIAASPVWPPADPSAVATLAARYDTFSPPVTERAAPLRAATPMLHVPDVRAAARWYESIGFAIGETYGDGGDGLSFAILSAGGTRVMLNEGGRAGTAERRDVDLYVDAERVDELFTSLRERVDVVSEPTDTEHGMREFIIRDPNGFWITFGERMAAG